MGTEQTAERKGGIGPVQTPEQQATALKDAAQAVLPPPWMDLGREVDQLKHLRNHPEFAAHMRAIKASPESDAPRLAWADWLDKHDCPGRAALVRTQCDPNSYPLPPDHLRELTVAFLSELPELFNSGWVGTASSGFHRGLPEFFLEGKPAVPRLRTGLRHPNTDIRTGAAVLLGRIGDPAAVPALIKSLTDPEPKVRVAATSALGVIGDPVAVPALAKALTDPELVIRMSAARSLGEIGDRADPVLTKALVPALTKALFDPELPVRMCAAWALGKLDASLDFDSLIFQAGKV